MSLRDRLNRLEAGLPDDPDRLCCLETASAQFYRGQGADPYPPFDFAAEPEPPPELPVLPFGGICKKTGEAICDFAREHAALIWTRRRRLAITTAGLDESEL
jgi:hypothetical protein